MGKINVLDKHVAELIAAGEVVERPSSVVKELVENSIDAGATSVTVEIQHGGITFMRVTDNGSGIAREDVKKAFLRHATSKVHHQDDLDRITTLGFRGEALASISAVSHVELLTRAVDELAGTSYHIDGGEEGECEDAGCARGTTFVIRDLFYNTPARMKFLKKDVSEGNAVAGVLDRMALSHPEVAFRFLRDGKETLKTPGSGKLKDSIYAVYGREFTAGLIPLEYKLNGVKVTGFISRPAAARPNRSMQHFFINGRYVKSRTASVALEEAFKGSIMVGKFAACVLHLEISCDSVDVNVHPAKIEVRFVNERPIFDAVYHAVKSALLKGDHKVEIPLKPAASPAMPAENPQQLSIPPRPVSEQAASAFAPRVSSPNQEEQPEVEIPPSLPRTPAGVHRLSDCGIQGEGTPPLYRNALQNRPHSQTAPAKEEKKEVDIFPSFPREISASQPSEAPVLLQAPSGGEKKGDSLDAKEEPAFGEREEKPNRLIGEAFHTYIIVEHGSGELMLIDKHAAHERMLYEKLKAESGESCAQMLLEPIVVTLDKNEYGALLENAALMKRAGFEIDDFGSGAVLVRSAPLSLEGEDVAASVMEIAGYLLENRREVSTGHLDWLYHNIACRAAVKAGARSKPQELIDLAQRLEDHPEIRYCPHGRPVSVILKKREIEKYFGRV